VKSSGERSGRQPVTRRLGALFVCLLLVLAAAADSAAAGECPAPQPNPFARTVARLPKLHSVPPGGMLSFGPTNLHLDAPPTVAVPTASVSFILSEESRHGGNLPWTVEIEALRLNASGAVVRTVDKGKYELAGANLYRRPKVFSVALGGTGIYRVDLVLDRGQHRLGEFSSYVRVLPPRSSATLLLGQAMVKPGRFLSVRTYNRGTRELGFSSGLGLLKRAEDGWQDVTPAGWLGGDEITVSGGDTSFCQKFRLPIDAEAGVYKVVRRVRFSDGHARRIGSRVVVS
jgi:hypothetical protein